ncbi:hypothetical protein D3C85_1312960 [compost metagenome]
MTQYLAIEAVAASSWPLRCRPMQWSTKTLATVSLVLTSASLNWVFWKSMTRLPNALRCLT